MFDRSSLPQSNRIGANDFTLGPPAPEWNISRSIEDVFGIVVNAPADVQGKILKEVFFRLEQIRIDGVNNAESEIKRLQQELDALRGV